MSKYSYEEKLEAFLGVIEEEWRKDLLVTYPRFI